MDIAVISNKRTDAWKIDTVEMIHENFNPESTKKEQFLKVVVEFQTIAQASAIDGFKYKIANKPIEIIFYLAQDNGQWLIYDMSEPEFPVMSINNALIYTKKMAQNSDDTTLVQFIKELTAIKDKTTNLLLNYL